MGQAGVEVGLGAVVGVDEQGYDAHQHDQAPGQGVQEELQGGTTSARPPEHPDEEVHRDEHGLEAQVEQEQVTGGEDDDDEGLQDQDQAGEQALPVGGDLPPGGQEDQGYQEGRQEQHRQAQPGGPQRPGDPDERDPGTGLGQLDGRPLAGVELAGSGHAQGELGHGEHEPQGAGPAAQGGHGPHDQRPGQGQEHHEGENREGGCHGGVGHVGYLSSQNLLARTATRTRSVPTSM